MKSGDQEVVDYILVNLASPAASKPSWERALAYRKLYATTGSEKKIQHRMAWKFDTEIFKNYGAGVYLYFRLVQMLFYTFLIISALSLPALLSNYKGDGLSIYGEGSVMNSLMKVSLANQRYEQFDKIVKDPSIITDIEVNQSIIIGSDVLCSILFLGFLILWKIKSHEAVEEIISKDSLPSYYTLIVRAIPPAYSYSQDLIREHFQKFGAEIAQLSTVYDYDIILTEVKELLRLVDEYQGVDNSKKFDLYCEMSKKITKIFQISTEKPLKPVLCLVTFEDMQMRNKIKNLYKYQVNSQQLKILDKMPKVQSCRVEPSSIIWENFHIGALIQIRQGLLIFTVLVVVLFLALVALFLGNARSTSVIEHQMNFSSQIDYTKDYNFRQAQQIGTLQVIFNFCSKLNYKNLTMRYSDFCKPYFDSYKQRFKGMLILSLLIVVINLLLNWILYELANFRRYKTKTEKSRFLIINIFILYFINTGILLMLVRLQLGDYSLGRFINSIIPLPPEEYSIEPYSDFTRKWYLHIGTQIVAIYAVSLLISPFVQILVGWFQYRIRMFRAKRAKTQKQMNELIVDSQFDFQTFYAMLLNACFVTMFYANAIPILYFLAAGAMFSLYLASFFVFKFFSCKPVMFDHTLNKVISKVLCVALILHQITSILYYFTEDIFPLHSVKENDKQHSVWHKFSQGAWYLIFAVLLLIFTLNYGQACKMARKVYDRFYHKTRKQKKPQKKKKLFREVFQDNTVAADAQFLGMDDYLSSYKMQDNPLYVDLCYALSILAKFQPYFCPTTTTSFSRELRVPTEPELSINISIMEEPEHIQSQRPIV